MSTYKAGGGLMSEKVKMLIFLDGKVVGMAEVEKGLNRFQALAQVLQLSTTYEKLVKGLKYRYNPDNSISFFTKTIETCKSRLRKEVD
jgi:hypothetical protein